MRLHLFAHRIFHLSLHPGGRSITHSHQNICLAGLPLVLNKNHSTLLAPASSSRQSKHSLPSRAVRPPLLPCLSLLRDLQPSTAHSRHASHPYLCDGNCAMVFQVPNGFPFLLLVVPVVCTGAGGCWAIDTPPFCRESP